MIRLSQKNADFHTSRIAVRREICYIIPMALRGGESSVNIAKKIRELRESVGENRTEFSKHAGIPVRTIEDWESGRRTPPEYIPRLLAYQLKYEELTEKGKKEKK